MMTAATEWPLRRLDELGSVGRGRSRHRPRNDARLYGGPYPFIQTGEVSNCDVYITSYSATYSDFGLSQSKLWGPGTLCIVNAGENTGETGILTFSACFPDSIIAFTADSEKTDVRFVNYALRLQKARWRTVTKGATQDNLSVDKLLSFPFPAPPLSVQRRIADILSAYDDLIINNTKRIKLLEEMAKSLFCEWFVHRLPDHGDTYIDQEVGRVPRGWAVRRLGDVLDTLESGVRPKGGVGGLSHGVPSIGAENIAGLGAYDYSKEKYVSREFFASMSRGHVRSGDVLLYKDGAHIGRKTMFGDGFPHRECAVNEHVFILRAKPPCTQSYVYFWLDRPEMTEKIRRLNANAAQPGINQVGVRGLPILLPDAGMMRRFDEVVTPILFLLFNLARKNRVLALTRQGLLPLLVTGRVGV